MTGMENLGNTVCNSILSGFICGGCAFVGGLISGPVGVGVGSVIGGTISATVMRFRSAPIVIREEFTENGHRDLLDKAKRTLIDAKEVLQKILLDLISTLPRCQSWQEAVECIVHPLLKELTEITLRSIIQYLTGY